MGNFSENRKKSLQRIGFKSRARRLLSIGLFESYHRQ